MTADPKDKLSEDLYDKTLPYTQRERALRRLLDQGGPEAAHVLQELALDEDPRLREVVAELLARSTIPGAEDTLKRLCSDNDRRVRQAAAQALSSIATEEHRTLFEELQQDRSPGVRRAAEQALGQLDEMEIEASGTAVHPEHEGAAGNGRLVLELDDEEAPPQPRAQRLVVELDDDEFEAAEELPGWEEETPSVQGEEAEGGSLLQRLPSTVWYSSAAALCGAVFAWLLTEFAVPQSGYSLALADLLRDAALFGAVVGAAIGGAMGATEGVIFQVPQRTFRGTVVGAAIGLAGGVLGGLCAQLVYGSVSASFQVTAAGRVLLRSVGWSIMGTFVGMSQSGALFSAQKLRNSVLGGAAGGLLGGVVFDLLTSVLATAAVSRAVAMIVLGLFIGFGIGLVEVALKEAWLRVTRGKLAGKEFILYSQVTTLGSSPTADIVLTKDVRVSPEHARITAESAAHVLHDLASAGGTYVNHRAVRRHVLRSGDIVGIGDTIFVYRDRHG